MDDIPLDGKRVLVRVGFDVSAGPDGKVDAAEDYRIETALPTIQELRRRRCRVLLLTHLGRPHEGGSDAGLEPVQFRLQELLGEDVRLLRNLYGDEVESVVSGMEPGGVVMLPNVRLDEREILNSDKLGGEIAHHAEAYVNEAFSNSHRPHTSMTVLPRLLPSCAGRQVVREVEALHRLQQNPDRPYVAITSGAKLETKVGILMKLLTKVDKLCVGGQIANVFLSALGRYPADRFSADAVEGAKAVLARAREKLLLPVDVVIGPESGEKKDVQIVGSDQIPSGVNGIWDIGPRTIQQWLETCQKAKTVMWNGPIGRFEVSAYARGTRELAEGLAKVSAFRVVGGGDTVNALEEYGLTGAYDHVSVGGGALVAFLEEKRMPGLEPLYAEE